MPLSTSIRAAAAVVVAMSMAGGFVRGEVAAKPPPAEVELLSNHDFSSATKDASFPDEWHRKPWTTWETEKDFHYLRLSTLGTAKEFNAWREIYIPPGVRAVEVSIRYRTKDVKLSEVKDAGLRAIFTFFDAVRIKFTPLPDPLALSNHAADWTVATARFSVPEDATSLWLSVGLEQVQSGTLDLADVRVKPIPAADVPAKIAASKDAVAADAIPIRREGPHTIIGYGTPHIWFIHPYVDVVGHDFDLGITNLVREARGKNHLIAVGVAPSLDAVNQADEKNTTYVFTYKNINYPLPEQAHRLMFFNTWLLPEIAWPAARTGRKDVVVIGSKTLHNNGDGLAANKDRWWQIQKDDPDLTLTVLDATGYYLPLPVWRTALLNLVLSEQGAPL